MNFYYCVLAIFITLARESYFQFVNPQIPLNQYQQFELQNSNRANGRNFMTPVFSMAQGYVGSTNNSNNFVAFRTEPLNINSVTFKNFGATRIQTPGIYLFTSSIAGLNNETTQVQLKVQDRVIATLESINGAQTSVSTIARVNTNESVYLEIVSGNIRENNSSNLALNTFSGIELVANASANPLSPQGFP